MPYIGDTDNSGPNLFKKIEIICNKLDTEDVFLFFLQDMGVRIMGMQYYFYQIMMEQMILIFCH